MRNLVEISTFTTPVSVPENGDAVAAETRDPSLQALTNRTLYLKNTVEALDSTVDGRLDALEDRFEPSSGVVLLPAPVAIITYLGAQSAEREDPTQWLPLDNAYGWLSQDVTARLRFDFTRLRTSSRILKVSALVAPGASRATTGDRMQFELARTTLGTYPGGPVLTRTVLGSTTDNGTNALQWVVFDFSGSPLNTFQQGIWGMKITTGVDSDTGGFPDAIYGIRLDYDATSHDV